MKQIDLEPHRYRVTGAARLVRSILHRPVFLTISTVLGVWVAAAVGTASASGGFARAPEWAIWTLYPSLVIAPIFFVLCALVDGDRLIAEEQAPERYSSKTPAPRSAGAARQRKP